MITGLSTIGVTSSFFIESIILLAEQQQVATAPKGELKLAQGLTGMPDTDNPNLSELQTMFSRGIKQNQQNAISSRSYPEHISDINSRLQRGVRLAENRITLRRAPPTRLRPERGYSRAVCERQQRAPSPRKPDIRLSRSSQMCIHMRAPNQIPACLCLRHRH